MEFLGERPVWSMSGSDMLTALDAVHAELARLKTYALHLIAGLDTTGHAKDLGAGDTARLLSMRYRLDPADVRRDLRLATALPKYAAVSAALPDPAGDDDAGDHGTGDDGAGDCDAGDGGAGDGSVSIHPAQAEAIVAALEKVPTTVPVDQLDVAEQQLVNLAAHFTPSELRIAGKRIRDLLDTDGPEPDEQKAYGREALTLTNADNGVKFRGYLANENAELLKTLIHAGARPHKTIDGELDPRPRDKRQADALSAVLSTAAAAADTGAVPGHGPKANLTVTIDLDDLRTATRNTTATARTTDTADATADTTETADATATATATANTTYADTATATANTTAEAGATAGTTTAGGGIGDLVFGDGLSAAAVRRLACDAKVIPVVLGSKSQPLDVGMAERLVTGPIRAALNTRDRGCVVCGAPPISCEAHHLIHWADGGPTSIDNLVLLCKRHHIDLHAGHWTITITDDGIVHVTRPTWANPDPIRRPKPQPPHPSPGGSSTPAPPISPGGPPAPAPPPDTSPGGPAARTWQWDNDPPWVTAEEAARLNPWGDTPDPQPRNPAPPTDAASSTDSAPPTGAGEFADAASSTDSAPPTGAGAFADAASPTDPAPPAGPARTRPQSVDALSSAGP